MSVEIVAEIGASHGQNLDTAKRLVVAAQDAGADAIKLQTYTPDTISFPGAGLCPSGPWRNRPLYDLYKEAAMSREMQEKLIAFCIIQQMPWFSTPFSPDDVDWLEAHGCPRYKVSSFDVCNDPLIDALKATKKPRIASDGMDRTRAMSAAGATGIVLRCVSDYPAYAGSYGLGDPPRGPWGISDHTTNPTLGVIAIAKGAVMIERHIKLDGDEITPDSSFATPARQFENCIHEWSEAEALAGSREHVVPLLKQIMPRPVTINGRVVWRRCMQEIA